MIRAKYKSLPIQGQSYMKRFLRWSTNIGRNATHIDGLRILYLTTQLKIYLKKYSEDCTAQ